MTIEEKIKEELSSLDVNLLSVKIANMTNPLKFKEEAEKLGIPAEFPGDSVREIFYTESNSYNSAEIRANIRLALVKLITEWNCKTENNSAHSHLFTYFNLISEFGIQSDPLYNWLLVQAKFGSFKKTHIDSYSYPLHLRLLSLLFFYVTPETAKPEEDIKSIIERDITDHDYSDTCFIKAWQISYDFAKDLIPKYLQAYASYVEKIGKTDKNQMSNALEKSKNNIIFQLENFLEAYGTSKKGMGLIADTVKEKIKKVKNSDDLNKLIEYVKILSSKETSNELKSLN